MIFCLSSSENTPTLTYCTGELRMLEVIQEAGDIVFVPEGWGHAILNLEDSIAVAYEIHK